MERYNASMKMCFIGWVGILLTIIVMMSSCGISNQLTDAQLEKRNKINYELDKLWIEYEYKSDSLWLELKRNEK